MNQKMEKTTDGCFHNGHYCRKGVLIQESLSEIKNYNWNFDDEDDNEPGFAYEDASVFLDGACNLFALAIQSKYGIPTFELYDKENRLIHCFGISQYKGQTVYIDVRGKTTDFCEFWNHFQGRLDQHIYMVKQNAIEEVAKLSEDEIYGYKFALWILSHFEEYYTR